MVTCRLDIVKNSPCCHFRKQSWPLWYISICRVKYVYMYIYNNFSWMPKKHVFRKCGDEKCSLQTVLILCLNVGRCHSVSTITRRRISSVISRVLNNNWKVWGFISGTCIIGVSIIVRCPQGQCYVGKSVATISFRKHVVLEWKLPLTRMIVLLPHIAVMAGRIWEACQLLRYFVNLPVSTTFYSFLLYIAALEQTFWIVPGIVYEVFGWSIICAVAVCGSNL